MKKNAIWILLFNLLLTGNCAAAPTKPQTPVNIKVPTVKVLIAEGCEFIIKPAANYIVRLDGRKGSGKGRMYIKLIGNAIKINGVNYGEVEEMDILAGEYFELNNKRYRGNIKIVKEGDKLLVVNILDIDSYLYGVLPKEVSPRWNIEALKAQAVSSRTYALYQIALARKKGGVFDLYSDTRSQVYGGMDAEDKFTSLAVDYTRGEVMRYDGRIIQAFYHACSGGMTESGAEVFNVDKPYLSATESPYAESYAGNKWKVVIPLERVAELVKPDLKEQLADVRVIERTESKRIKILQFTDRKGNTSIMTGYNFRKLIGATLMKSTRANISTVTNTVVIVGVGYGHGVGMGQWDAKGMADNNYSYKSILAFFYRGTTIDKLW